MGKRGVRGGMGGYLKQDDEREASRLELELRTGQSWILGWFVILYLGYHCTRHQQIHTHNIQRGVVTFHFRRHSRNENSFFRF